MKGTKNVTKTVSPIVHVIYRFEGSMDPTGQYKTYTNIFLLCFDLIFIKFLLAFEISTDHFFIFNIL